MFDQKQAKVTDSQLICYMHSVFDSSASRDNFSKGCAVQDNTGLVKLIRARARILIADWEQHVRAFNLTGYNGSNACGVCSNVLGRCRPFVDPLLVHLHSSEYHKFRYHTPASLAAQADNVKHVAEHTPGRLRAEQQASGLKYEAVGLMWNLEVRTKMEPPYCEVQDWMHTYAASGGVAQYHVNGFVNASTANTAITLDDIDEWKNGVVLPKGVTKLKPNFFRDRIVEAPGRHIRAFASEVLTCVMLLGVFVDIVLVNEHDPDNMGLAPPALQPYLDCFALLRILLNIFERGDINYLNTCRQTMHTHHILFARLYLALKA